MKDRVILHSDLNNFYASVECLINPQLKEMPVAVCGDKESRHGIVLAKNYIAKSFGIKTGQVIWQAKQLCPNLILVGANFPIYLQYSRKVRQIYEDFTDQVEAFGIDECWLDVTDSINLFGSGKEIADEIRRRIKTEIGITASIGVSYNKIFAKLGSDMRKPDATTLILKENFKELVWPLPVEDLLYVGKATKQKLNKLNVNTIGELATSDLNFLIEKLGKWGEYLYSFANGTDNSPVTKITDAENIKSIGNSLTNYKDMRDEEQVYILVQLLCESVASRLRDLGGIKARTVHISVKDNRLESFAKQGKLNYPSRLCEDFTRLAMELFREVYRWNNPVRSIGISISDFDYDLNEQTDMFQDLNKYKKQEKLEETVDKIRNKYGYKKLRKAIILKDKKLGDMNIKSEHVIHPENYFK